MNRYVGNTGRFSRINDAAPRLSAVAPVITLPPARRKIGLPAIGLELGDLALLLLFFFLYMESGDEDFLIILAVLAVGAFIK
ncbi:MAG: hypothetical protein LBH17_08365 [Oscillospiraceae bacterium]|jgi:hypothetical protein|nr:hypothetical protein [Oscillospiraceae bacterium]